jgi:hypothetical protein
MFHPPSAFLKTNLMLAVLSTLTACISITDQPTDTYRHQQRDLREECLRALKWRQQQSLDGLFDDDASEGDRLVSAIVYSNTNNAEERLKCESLGLHYELEAVPEKPRSKKNNIKAS